MKKQLTKVNIPMYLSIPTQTPYSRRLTIPSDLPSQASGNRRNRPCRFQCLLCHNVSPFSSLGTFKHHVTYYPRSQFLCPNSPQCPWLSSRRDKIHEHLRTRHSMLSPLSKQEIKDLEVSAIPPVNPTQVSHMRGGSLWVVGRVLPLFFQSLSSRRRAPVR